MVLLKKFHPYPRSKHPRIDRGKMNMFEHIKYIYIESKEIDIYIYIDSMLHPRRIITMIINIRLYYILSTPG